MRKIIFLDVDGVLCVPHKQIKLGIKVNGLNTYLDDESLMELKRIVDETGAEIVMSSAWRIGWNPQDPDDDHDLMSRLLERFKLFEIPEPIGRTKAIGGRWMEREFEILTWLKENGNGVETWIAIDDETLALGPHYFKTRNHHGLEPWIADRAIKFLNTPYKEIQLQYQKVNVPFHTDGKMNGAWMNGELHRFENNTLTEE